jgi:WD40 repeat protein
MVRDGYYADAVDTYLNVLAEHPGNGTCLRRLLQHAAEAALDVRAMTLSTQLAQAATAGTPTKGRTAAVVARAHAISARALADAGRTAEATNSLEKAQHLSHNHRSTARYVKWTAVNLALASRPISSTDDLIENDVREIGRQGIRHLLDAEISLLYLGQGRMLCTQGMHREAVRLYAEAAKRIGVEPHLFPDKWHPFVTGDGRWQIPPEWHLWCRAWASAVAGLGGCLVHLGGQPDDQTRDSLSTALSLAVALGAAEIAVALALDLETLDTRDVPGRIKPPAPITKALSLADYHLFTFVDITTQQRWTALRRRLRSRGIDSDGPDPAEADVSAPWPLAAHRLPRLVEAGTASLKLFDRLAQARSGALGTATLSVAHAALRDLLARIHVRPYDGPDGGRVKEAVLELTAALEGIGSDRRLDVSHWANDSAAQTGFTPAATKALTHPPSETLERVLAHAEVLAGGRAIGTLDVLAATSTIDAADWTAFLVGAGVGPPAIKAEPGEGATPLVVGGREVMITERLFESILRGERLAASLNDETVRACHVVYGLLTDRRTVACQWLLEGGCSQHELVALLGSRVFGIDLPTVDGHTGPPPTRTAPPRSTSSSEGSDQPAQRPTGGQAGPCGRGSEDASAPGRRVSIPASQIAESSGEQPHLVIQNPGRGRSWRRTRLVRWSPDGNRLATHDIVRTSKAVRIWDMSTGAVLRVLEDTRKVCATSWSPDGTRLATGVESRLFQLGKGVRLWDATTGVLLWALDQGSEGIRQRGPFPQDWSDEPVSWSPDGSRLAVTDGRVDFKYVVHILEARTGSVLRTIAKTQWAMWSPDGRWLATSTGRTLTVWDAQADARAYAIDDLADAATSRWSPSGTMLAALRRGTGFYVGIWDAGTGASLRVLSRPVGSYGNALSWSPDSSLLAITHDRRSSVFDTRSGDFVFAVEDVESMTWSPDSSQLATVHWNGRETARAGEAKIWDAATGALLRTLADTLWLAWSPDGTQLAVTRTDRTIRVWRIAR